MIDLTKGIAVDAAHSMKNKVTEFQGIDLKTGERVFYKDLGFETINIGEFLAIVEAAKYIIKSKYEPKIIYSDSLTAITWFKNKNTASQKRNWKLKEAEIYLKVCSVLVDEIEVKHWNNRAWGDIPADFGRKG